MENIITRLKKVEGQVKGLIKMIENNRDCENIITQFQATKAALDSAFSEALNSNLLNCLNKKETQKIEKIIKLIAKK